MPASALSRQKEELDRKVNEAMQIISTGTQTEKDYITKPLSQRDQYDVAFGKLNPESRAKAEKFHSLMSDIRTINNQMVDLNSAKEFFGNLYNQQRAETNAGFDDLQRGNAISSNIALSSALATAGGMGANGMQTAGLKAQQSNTLFAEQLKAEAQRQKDLAAITQAEAQVPLQLANIGQINYQISKPETPAASYGGGGGRPGGRRSDPKIELPPKTKKEDDETIKKLAAAGYRQMADGGWLTPGGEIVKTEDALKGYGSDVISEDKVFFTRDKGETVEEISKSELEKIQKDTGGKSVMTKIDGVYVPRDKESYLKGYHKPYRYPVGEDGLNFKETYDYMFNKRRFNDRTEAKNIKERLRKTKELYDLKKNNFIE